jgi:hypothetical protein
MIAVAAPAAPSALVIANHYCRLHQRLNAKGALFDPSWGCDANRSADRLAWVDGLHARIAPGTACERLFHDPLERLMLLAPPILQKLFCAVVLQSRREQFRRCIDGPKVRALHELIGSDAMFAIRSSRIIYPEIHASVDWGIPALLAEAFGHFQRAGCPAQALVASYVRIGLPLQLPAVPPGYDSATFRSLLRDTHHFFPELKWLFG